MTNQLDEKWYQKLRDIARPIGESFNLLEPSLATLDAAYRQLEDSGYTEAVSLFPDPEVITPLEEPYTRLGQLRLEIAENEPNHTVQKQYLAYIDDVRANVDMIRAACRQDSQEYERLNDLLYGKPDRTIYEDVCEWIRQDTLKTISQTDDENLAASGQEVLARLPETNGDSGRLVPSEAVFRSVREEHFKKGGFFETLFGEGGLPDEPYIDQEQGDDICRKALANIGADYEIVDSHNHIWSVSREPRLLLRPTGYRLARDEFVGIVAHEIGSHILESANGAKHPLRLLEMGLAGYVLANEGRALIREQIVYNDIETALQQPAWEYCVMKHLAISLSVGYNGGRRYQLPEIYELLYRLYYFWRTRRHPQDTNNELFARKEAWLLTVRLLKGTDGHGGCYQKDMVYLEGSVKIWQFAAKNPSIVLFGDEGKFNLLNHEHVELVTEL